MRSSRNLSKLGKTGWNSLLVAAIHIFPTYKQHRYEKTKEYHSLLAFFSHMCYLCRPINRRSTYGRKSNPVDTISPQYNIGNLKKLFYSPFFDIFER